MGTIRTMKLKTIILLSLSCCLLLHSCGKKGQQPNSGGSGQTGSLKGSELSDSLFEKYKGSAFSNSPGLTYKLEIGYALSIGNFGLDTLAYSKQVGVDHLEASGMGLFVNSDRNFRLSDEEIVVKLKEAKTAADKAGINIWSIHMPFGPRIDLSLRDEQERQQVVAMHQKLLGFLKILEPEVILFHPSYYLGLEEREIRKDQLVISALELDRAVQKIGAVMVLENMLGPELLYDETKERPLMRSVEESVEIFDSLPVSIGLAVDTNHISEPEELILALGTRLKSLHIADGTGKAENHWFPCHYKGDNDWNKILAALEKVGYTGPFMYESSPSDAREFRSCYQRLHQNFIDQL
jgi:hexosaminidase